MIGISMACKHPGRELHVMQLIMQYEFSYTHVSLKSPVG